MADRITIELAGEPRGKGRHRFVRATGHIHPDAKTERYEHHLKLAGMVAMRGRAPLEGALRATVLARVKIPASWSRRQREDAVLGITRPTGKPDADNFLKILDALNKVVWLDDAQIVEATIRKVYSTEPGLVITVARECP